MGTREAGFASSLPAYRKFESARDRRELADLLGVEETSLPRSRGYAYPDIVGAILAGEIKGLWIVATNPLVSYPNRAKVRQAFAQLDFLAVQDGFHPTSTTEVADLVLPAAIWGEKEGTFTNSERRVSKVNRAVEPPGEARSDFDIFLDIARRLDVDRRLFPGWREPRDAFDEWRRVSKGRLCDYSGITYEMLEAGPVQWPRREGAAESDARLYADGVFASDDGRATLFCVRSELPPEEPDPEYPFLLNTGRTVEHWHTRTKTGRIPILERSAPEAWVEINPGDAARLGLRNHDWVSLRSRRGRIDRIRARVTAVVAPGQVFVPFHFAEACANDLTLDDSCPIARQPNFKQCAVAIEGAQRVRRGRPGRT
jgi:assimilatory nitrate reductase catalytic subunit